MRNAWQTDLGDLEHTFIFQAQACGGFGITPECMIQVQEAQRQIALENSDVSMLTTGNFEMASDNCHFTEEGYLQAGNDLSSLLTQNLYNHQADNNLPFIRELTYSDCSRTGLILSLNDPENINIDLSHLSDLQLNGDSITKIESIHAAASSIIINFNQPLADQFSGLSYLTHSFSGTPLFLVNGRSLPQFYALKASFPDLDKDGYNCIIDCNDKNALIFPDAADDSINGIDENCDGFDGPFNSKAQELDMKTKVFPLPTYGNVDIHFSIKGTYVISIMNSRGELLKELAPTKKQVISLELSGLIPGNYFLNILHQDWQVRIAKRLLKY